MKFKQNFWLNVCQVVNGATTRPMGWCLAILGTGFVLRLAWLYDPGFVYDISVIVGWMRWGGREGVGGILAHTPDRVYWPLALYLLTLLGQFNREAISATPTFTDLLLLRLTSILLDLLITAVMYRLGRQITRSTRWALFGALLYALWPSGIYSTGWWGQLDSWYLLPLLLAVGWLAGERVELAWLALALAIAVKVQAVTVLPVFVIGTWRWWGWRALVKGSLTAGLALGVLFVPLLFMGLGSELLSKATLAYSTAITISAHNLWFALVPMVGNYSIGDLDVIRMAGGVSFYDAGIVLTALAQMGIGGRLLWRSGPRSVAAASALAVLSTAMLLTRMSWRYYMAALVLFILAGFFDKRWWAIYGLLALTQLINLFWDAQKTSPFRQIPEIGVLNAWGTMMFFGLGLWLFLAPLRGSAALQARIEGSLRAIRSRRELAVLVSGALLGLGFLGAFLWRGHTVGEELLALREQLYTGLRAALADVKPNERMVIFNWPRSLEAKQVRLFGLVPVTPPIVYMDWPETLAPGATSLQLSDWAEGNAAFSVEFAGKYIPIENLRTLFWQTDRVIDFHAPTMQMYVLSQKLPVAAVCRAEFGEAVCLADAQVFRQDGELKLELTWQEKRAPAAETTVFVHVRDAEGNVVAQADGDLARNLLPLADWPASDFALRETRWVAVPAGDYTVRIGLYNRVSGERLAVACVRSEDCNADGAIVDIR